MVKEAPTAEPLVSIIMNCYNGERYLREAIESILAQTYQNWELVFWDNQSSDSSAEIFKSFDDPRFKYFHAPGHTPLYEARGLAVAKASGHFFAFLDVDDWWLPEKLERQIALFDDPAVGLVYGNYYWVDGRRGTTRVRYTKPLTRGDVLPDVLRDYSVGLLTIVVRREAAERLSPFFNPEYDVIGDFDMVVRLAVDWKFDCVQDPIACCRWHGENMQIKKASTWTKELDAWVMVINQNEAVRSVFPSEYYKSLLDRRKVVEMLVSGRRDKALDYVRRVRAIKSRILLTLLCIMPTALLKRRYA